MWYFINWQTTAECVFISLIFACFLSIICFKSLGALQSLGYSCRKFLGWAGRKNNLAQTRLTLLALATLLSSAVISLSFTFAGRWAAVIGLVAYLIFFVLYFAADAGQTFKSNVKLTPRFKRLYITLFITFAVLTYLSATLLNFADYMLKNELFRSLKYCALSVLPLAAILVVCLANLIAKIWETPINASYIKRAKEKLASSGVTVVAITGSYGKTSVKNILSAMLSKKYRVSATPSSYNTPIGIAKAINGDGLRDCNLFIAEMGARQRGDIEKLCAMCTPDYSLITGICPQHLESFKTEEAIIATKGEIIAATRKTCFIAGDCYDLFGGINGNKVACNAVQDVVADCTGTEFTLELGGKQTRVKTRLLGEHSAYNIGLCACVAYELGVTIGDIAEVIASLPYIEHRLQLIESGGVNIIDDGYNANVVGAKAAVKVLKSFGGKRIVVTPGIVELGVLEESANEELGAELVGLEYVVLVGETLVRAVERGYLQAGGDAERLTVVPSLTAAQDKLKNIISKGDTVLFLNDLPEIYR